jgi:hypothetical protein
LGCQPVVIHAKSSSPPSPIPHHLENETWSKSEKTIARTAFDVALGRELHEVIQEVKRMASEIQELSELWDLEHYLRCLEASCTKIDSVRKICPDCVKTR